MKKQITIKEAANNLSTLTNAVDENGIISITKYTKEKYIIMTKEEYDRRFNSQEKLIQALTTPIIGTYIHKTTHSEGICKVRAKNKTIEIITVEQNTDNEPVAYSRIIIPQELVRLSETSIWQIEYDLKEILFKGCKSESINLLFSDNEKEKSRALDKINTLKKEYSTSDSPETIELIY